MAYPQPTTSRFETVMFDGYYGTLSRGGTENPHLVVLTYGGDLGEKRTGKGIVVSYDGIHIHYCRKPSREWRTVVINDLSSSVTLASYGL